MSIVYLVMDKVLEYIKKFNMIEKGDTVIAGISGGADSVCLLFVLLKLRELWGINVVAVHVNHGLRGEDADADEDFTVGLCRENGVRCVVYRKNVKEMAKQKKLSLEEAGRDARREAFREALEAEHGTKIATAHHKNDNAETFIMNLARGSGLKGLAGIPPKDGDVIHPLLCLTRDEIESYVAGIGCGWRTDLTNREEDYTRNLIRQRVIPTLEGRVNSGAVEHINEAAGKIRQAFEYMRSEADAAVRECVSRALSGEVRIDGKKFAKYGEAIQGMAALQALKLAAGSQKDIGDVHVKAVLRLFKSQCGRAADLPYGLCAKRDYDGVSLFKKPEAKGPPVKKAPVRLNIPGETYLPGENLRVSARVFDKPGGFSADKLPESPCTKWFDYDIISGGLYIRRRRGGDYITVGPSGGKQKLKSYFINEKIPAEKRGGILLLADGKDVLWVIGHRTNAAFYVTAGTKKILEVKLSEEKEMSEKIEVLIPENKVVERIAALAEEISRDYKGRRLHLIGILKGGAFFMCELAKRLTIPVTLDFMSVSSYGDRTVSSGVVRIIKDLDEPIHGKDVLIVEDIIDTGRTLYYLMDILKRREPDSLRLCALLDKPERRQADVKVDYRGFEIPDEFIVGYGLDYAQKYRNLPYVGVIKFGGEGEGAVE